jgi:hypothetical protein
LHFEESKLMDLQMLQHISNTDLKSNIPETPSSSNGMVPLKATCRVLIDIIKPWYLHSLELWAVITHPLPNSPSIVLSTYSPSCKQALLEEVKFPQSTESLCSFFPLSLLLECTCTLAWAGGCHFCERTIPKTSISHVIVKTLNTKGENPSHYGQIPWCQRKNSWRKGI